MKKAILLILQLLPVLFGLLQAHAQSVSLHSGLNQMLLNQAVTAINIQRQSWETPLYMVYNNQSYLITRDEHEGEKNLSSPIIFDSPTTEFTILSIRNEQIICLGVFAPPLNSTHHSYKKSPELCEPTPSVPASVWRAGLAAPKPGRSFTDVKHGIVHHSAGLIFHSNYTEVVRNIYLLHTQNNGWDDIGYNYLIAWDGTFFQGRDPEGGEQSDVLGAHFCSKNSNTMGVCMIGTYTDTLPSDTALEVLTRLLTWKFIREQISPQDSFLHPEGSGGSSQYLRVLSGHRDGCSTECPGETLYQKIPALAHTIADRIAYCNQLSGTELQPQLKRLKCYRTDHQLFIENLDESLVLISDASGRVIYSTSASGNISINLNKRSPYFIWVKSKSQTEKIVLF